MTRIVTIDDLERCFEELSNWGRWGPNDEIGTLNFVTCAEVTQAAQLVRKGKRISLCLPFDQNGPQSGSYGRFNPIHFMKRDGADGFAGLRDKAGIRGADDWIVMPLQCGTQWDGLAHIFFRNQMYNGYDIRECSSEGTKKNGIEKTKAQMAGRGVLLDVAREMDMPVLPDGFAITGDLLDRTAAAQGVEVRRGDFLIVRTGQIESCLERRNWGGFAGGDAPGLAFETLHWLHRKEVAAVATDTWGAEVRPNYSPGINQPWHWIAIPVIGLTVGEIFLLGELARDCAEDGIYEFFFCAPSLPFTGAVGSPCNPMAFK